MRQRFRWRQKAPYILLLVLLLFWTVFFTGKWADRRLDMYASETSARLYRLNGTLRGLPQPDSIRAGQTSGNAAGVISKYDGALADLQTAKEKLGLPTLPQLFLFWRTSELNHLNAEANKALDNTIRDLEVTKNALRATKKFLEYSPANDLATIDQPNSDAQERLTRTKDGLIQTADQLRNSNYQYAQELAEQILPLTDRVMGLTGATLPAWNDAVLKAQTTLIETFQEHWEPYTQATGAKLNGLAGSFAAYQ